VPDGKEYFLTSAAVPLLIMLLLLLMMIMLAAAAANSFSLTVHCTNTKYNPLNYKTPEEAHSLKHDFKCRSFNDRTFDRLQAVNNDDDQEEEEEEEEPHELRRRLSFPFKEQLNEDALKLRKSRGLYPDLSQGSKLHRKTTRMEDESESSYASIVLGKDSTQSMFPGSTVLSSSVTVTVTSSRNQADFAKSALGRIGNKYNENENNNNTMVDSVPALMPYSILLKDETGHTSQTESTAGITRSTTTTARNMDDSLNASCTQSDAAGRSYVGSFGSSATLAVDSSFIQEWVSKLWFLLFVGVPVSNMIAESHNFAAFLTLSTESDTKRFRDRRFSPLSTGMRHHGPLL